MPLVLIAEDYPDAREMMCLALGMLGYEVMEAEDGAQAVALALEAHPDLILLDLNLPLLDGFQAAALIRRQPATKNIPIIACTARHQTEWHNRALAAGCNEFIRKPLNFDELEQILRRYLPVAP